MINIYWLVFLLLLVYATCLHHNNFLGNMLTLTKDVCIDTRTLSLAMSLLHPKRFNNVVDMGCGSGTALTFFAQCAPNVIGVDLHASTPGVIESCLSEFEFEKHVQQGPVLIYAYDPLWKLPHHEAEELYTKMVSNLAKIHHLGVTILFVTGFKQKDVFINAMGREPDVTKKVGALVLNRQVQVYNII